MKLEEVFRASAIAFLSGSFGALIWDMVGQPNVWAVAVIGWVLFVVMNTCAALVKPSGASAHD